MHVTGVIIVGVLPGARNRIIGGLAEIEQPLEFEFCTATLPPLPPTCLIDNKEQNTIAVGRSAATGFHDGRFGVWGTPPPEPLNCQSRPPNWRCPGVYDLNPMLFLLTPFDSNEPQNSLA